MDTTLRDGEQTSGGFVQRPRKTLHRPAVAGRTACEPHRDSLGAGFAGRAGGRAPHRRMGCREGLYRPHRGVGIHRRRRVARLARPGRVSRGEPAGKGVAQTLPRTVAPHPAGAPLRHPRHDRRGHRAGHEGERLPRRLVERYAAFARVRLHDTRRAGRRPRAALHVPRHAGHPRPLCHRTVLPRHGDTLSAA